MSFLLTKLRYTPAHRIRQMAQRIKEKTDAFNGLSVWTSLHNLPFDASLLFPVVLPSSDWFRTKVLAHHDRAWILPALCCRIVSTYHRPVPVT